MSPRSTPVVICLNEASADAAYATIVVAFVGDPATRWTWPQPADYLRNMPLLARAFGSKAFGLKTADAIEGMAGVALWLPPDVGPDDDALGPLIERTIPASIRSDAMAVFEQMARFHPHEPHWYLPLIAVDPARQGQQLGERLMSHALSRCDADGVPAYLESSNPRNLPFYQRQGFEILGKIQAGTSPTIVPMLRRPQVRR